MPIHARPRKGPSRHKSRIQKTKNRSKDIDQIQEELGQKSIAEQDEPVKPEYDEDLPGGGQYPCEACGRNFVDQSTLEAHVRSKTHKKRLKELEEEPYSYAEAEAAGGLGSYNPPPPSKKRKRV